MIKRYAVLLTSLILVSCASAPPEMDVEPDVNVPDGRLLDAEFTAEVDSAWWSEFNDEQLNQLVAEAFDMNYDLAIAAANLNAAAAQAKIAGAPVYPQADLSFSESRRKQNFIGFPIPGAGRTVLSSTSNSYGVSMNVSWELDLWGRLRAGQAQAVAQMQAAEADYIAARLSLAAQVTKVWFAAIEAQGQLELSQATADNWCLSRDRVQRRYESGLAQSLDLRLSRSSLANAEANLSSSRLQRDSVIRQLETLVRRYPSASLAPGTELPDVLREVPAGLPSDLLFRRPDLAASERRLAASYSGVSSARRALLPRINLTASGGTSSDQLRDLLDGDPSVWSLAGGLLQPLLQGGRLRANVELARSGAEAALAAYQRAILAAFAEVENALASERYLEEREVALKEATAQAIAAQGLAEAQYDKGLLDFVTMLEAQRSAYLNEQQLLSVRRQRLDARVDLYLALGGGFSRTMNSDRKGTRRK